MAAMDGGAVVCPFYLREAPKSVACEGLSDGTVTLTRFTSREAKERYKLRYCDTFTYSRCPLAAALAAKYEEN